MKVLVTVFCLLRLNFLVTSIPVNQVLPALQTCPCNQNSYSDPANVPIVLQQTNSPQQFIQQTYVPTVETQMLQPTNALYSQYVTAQNPMIAAYQNQQNIPSYVNQIQDANENALTNQITQYLSAQNPIIAAYQNQHNIPSYANQILDTNQNSLTDQINQMYMNKILSLSAVQSVIDNSLMYNPLGVDVSDQLTSSLNTGNVPHVINNYFIIPPETLQDICVANVPTQPYTNNNDLLNAKINSLKTSQNDLRRRRIKNQRKDDSKALTDKNNGRLSSARKEMNNNANEQNKRIRERNRHVGENPEVEEVVDNNQDIQKQGHENKTPEHTNNLKENENTDQSIRNTDRRRKRKRKQKVTGDEVNIPLVPNGESKLENDASHKVENNIHNLANIVDDSQKLVNSVSDLTKLLNPSAQQADKNIQQTPVITHHPRNNNNMPIFSRDDVIIKTFREKFPAIPEETVRNLLSYLRKQFQNNHPEMPRYPYSDMNFPLRYDQLFPQSRQPFLNPPNRNNRRRNSNKKGEHKPMPRQKPTNSARNITNVITTPSNSSAIPKGKLENNNYSRTISNVPVTEKTSKDDNTTNLATIVQKPKLVSDVFDGIDNDYYPDFKNDKKYIDSHEINNVRNLRDDRYYYTTDKNDEMEKFSNKKIQENNFKIAVDTNKDIENSLTKPVENEYVNKKENEITQFRTPPLLESPNFKTRQISKTKAKDSSKSSNYSDVKTSQNAAKKPENKKRADNIETDYAHSKVAKYGKSSDNDDEKSSPFVTYYLPDNMEYEEDGKTVIVARSVPDDFW